MSLDKLSLADIDLAKLYDGTYHPTVDSRALEAMLTFFNREGVRRRLEPILQSDQLLIKVNLSLPRPPESGANVHPVALKALLKFLTEQIGFEGIISVCETDAPWRGPNLLKHGPNVELFRAPGPKNSYSWEFVAGEKEELAKRILVRDPKQDPYEFGFDLALAVSGFRSVMNEQDAAKVRLLNLTRQAIFGRSEIQRVAQEVEFILKDEATPVQDIRCKILEEFPEVPIARGERLGLISLAVPKTHNTADCLLTLSIKNIGIGMLLKKKKVFAHQDLAKTIVYNCLLWKKACKDRVFGIVSGPLGMEGAGPIAGRAADFPYVVAGSDLLAVDSASATLMLGNPQLVRKIELFSRSNGTIGQIPAEKDLERLRAFALGFKLHPDLGEYRSIE